jgi:[glutamine synthetase] adenylyltransferase / [glutamine synthetase]-adenylyl-L-tyrosine phosphorylase
MRLRPSGNKGPVSVMLDGFERYFAEEAWTWEFMALTRARIVAASDPAFAGRVERAISVALLRPRQPAELWTDVAAMRARIQREHGGGDGFDLKHRRGGLLDLDFLLQGLVLEQAGRFPDLIQRNTHAIIDRLAAHNLVPADQAAALAQAARLFQTVQGLLRLTTGGRLDPAHPPAGLKTVLARAAGTVDFAALERNITAAAEAVAGHYLTTIAARTGLAPDSIPGELKR